MKIAHLSDLHICLKYKRKNLSIIKKLINRISSFDIDHLVISGDITDNAREEDFLWFRNLLKENDLLRSDRTSIVIGNHDIFGGVQTASDIIDFPSKCARVDFKDKVREFVNYFEELFENIYSPSDRSIFPYVKDLGDACIVGINSIDRYSTIRNPFASNGYVTKEEINDIQKIFDLEWVKNKIKLVVIHHHFYKNNISSKSSEHALWSRLENFTMKLRRKKRLIKLFKNNSVDLVLHGHSHEIKQYARQGITFLNAGGLFEDENNLSPGYFTVECLVNQIKIDFEIPTDKYISISKEKVSDLYISSVAN